MTLKPYLLEYNHAGTRWCVEVPAASFEDAEERKRAIYYARVLGTVEAKIPAGPGSGLLVRAFCWLRNRLSCRVGAC